jgi:hypothetical protein
MNSNYERWIVRMNKRWTMNSLYERAMNSSYERTMNDEKGLWTNDEWWTTNSSYERTMNRDYERTGEWSNDRTKKRSKFRQHCGWTIIIWMNEETNDRTNERTNQDHLNNDPMNVRTILVLMLWLCGSGSELPWNGLGWHDGASCPSIIGKVGD